MSEEKKSNLMYYVFGAVVIVALVMAFAPGLLSWVLPGMGAVGLAGAAAVNKEKRKEEKAATAADKKELAETQQKIDAQKAELSNTQKEQQQLFISHDKTKEELEAEYKGQMEAQVAASQEMTAAEQLAYLKTRKPTRPPKEGG